MSLNIERVLRKSHDWPRHHVMDTRFNGCTPQPAHANTWHDRLVSGGWLHVDRKVVRVNAQDGLPVLISGMSSSQICLPSFWA